MPENRNAENVLKALDICYQKCLSGIEHVSPPIEQLASNYQTRKATDSEAAKSMIRHQIIKCTTSGFITGFGGAISLPVTIPANLGSVLYVQMRMVACTAYIAGYDVKSDQVQTLIYACLAGVAINELIKKAGIKVGEKLTISAIKRIPGKVLTKINQKVGFRLLTKFGETGIINLGKLVPGVGAVINGGLDLAETKAIGNRAYKWFFEGDYSAPDEENVIDAVELQSPTEKDADYYESETAGREEVQ